jgi:hypothetical protein
MRLLLTTLAVCFLLFPAVYAHTNGVGEGICTTEQLHAAMLDSPHGYQMDPTDTEYELIAQPLVNSQRQLTGRYRLTIKTGTDTTFKGIFIT